MHCSILSRELRIYVVMCRHLSSNNICSHLMKMEISCSKHLMLRWKAFSISPLSNSHRQKWDLLNYLVFFSDTHVFPALFFSDWSLRPEGSEEGPPALRYRGQRGFDQRLDDSTNRCKMWDHWRGRVVVFGVVYLKIFKTKGPEVLSFNPLKTKTFCCEHCSPFNINFSAI